MTETCAHCGTALEERRLIDDESELDGVRSMKVGCRKCQTPVCLACGHAEALGRGIPRNCLCPGCGAELGLDGLVDELGEDYYGWGY